ncbi:hypothetical protein G3N59_07900 [Paraburkholderia sp. Ac-20340]|uniref:hypothetical protein n=1 Tax=Paraburkholderia sp. Ac-20340 TaxID=2703888 RepID=UPI0019824F9D|nr:hypothetical protein [Paraburkholderia sp. Ac-20340]MBN3853295.1 hypothetical protein [Paraburkholderia sp. Ac-20340]
MANQNSEGKINAIMTVLRNAMLLVRDNAPLNLESSDFGSIQSVEKSPFSEFGSAYTFRNKLTPESDIKIITMDDPLNYSDDRSRVAIVPSSFELNFYVVVRDITPSMLKEQLDLADYWIDADGEIHNYNDMGPGISPMPKLHLYLYRANMRTTSQFPVDVELSYGDGTSEESSGTKPSLWTVNIRRAYPYLTPAMRKQKREEAAARANAAYGKSKGGEQ